MKAVIDRVRVYLGRGHVSADGIKVDVVVCVNDSATKFNRGNMTFTCRPETHDEAQRSLVNAFLIWVGNN
jgi:hypothetical protein